MYYGIGEDELCYWIADLNKFYRAPEYMREIADYRFCSLSRGKCPVIDGGECWFPKARRMDKEFDPQTMNKE